MSDIRDLLSRMADELDHYRQLLSDDRREVHALAAEGRAALAAEPVEEGPTNDELAAAALDALAHYPYASELPYFLTSDSPEYAPFMVAIRAAIAVARAALAEPVGEGPPAVTTSVLLHPAYEPGDGSADGAQMVGLAWWHPIMGCDSLQIVVDNARNILRSRPAAPPAQEPGEVGELVAALKTVGSFRVPTYKQLNRAATLLEQLSALAPVVVPVAIPGEQWHEDEGACLWWRFPIEEPPWSGDPRGDDWPGYHTHFTRIVCPLPQAGEGQP